MVAKAKAKAKAKTLWHSYKCILIDIFAVLPIPQLGILGSTDFFEKFWNCFWWGLRNLSSFGSNLNNSINMWENIFGAFISIVGLLLFIYLIGNLQTYMQLATERSEKYRLEKRIAKKIEKIGPKVGSWLSKNGIPSSKKSEIMVKVKEELEANEDVGLEHIILNLPLEVKSSMESCMPLKRLKQVPLLQNTDEKVLMKISEYLKPEKYTTNEIIIREKEPLEKMIFIVEGLAIIGMTDCSGTLKLSAGEVYGEKLLTWPAWTSFPSELPKATESLRADGDVKALDPVPISIHGVSVHFNIDILVLTAKDLGNFKSHFSKHITSPTDSSLDLCATVGLTWLKKGPSIFQSMEEEMLTVISKRLKLQNYSTDTYIVQENKELEYMFIFVEGSSMSIESTRWPCTFNIGDFYGQELVHWVTYWSLHTTFPDKFPLSTSTVKVSLLDETGNAGVLVLSADKLKSLVSAFRWKFIKAARLPVDSGGKLLAFDTMATLKKVQELKGLDDSKLEEIGRSLVLKTYKEDTSIIQRIDSGIDKMFLIVSGVVSVRSITGGENVYRYSGDYCGGELLEWALRPPLSPNSRTRSLPKSDVCVEAVGEVEARVLQADDLKSLFPMPSDKNNSVDQQVGSSSKKKGIDDNVVDPSKVEGQKITEPSPINVRSPPRSRHVGSSSRSEHKKIDDDGDSSKGKSQIVAGGRSRTLRSHLTESKLVKGTFDKLNSVRGMYKKYKEEKRNR
ncbi:hypothetical protein M0R45_037124 [Rubus argutus]|uniref:Cyclic nucleotide-binding domain-containing protein n=1 Tax=Rubus argutus TaxID=59490 RepID=A0AAW1VYA7_RUBAR